MTILIVDDDLFVHSTIRSIVEGTQYGFAVVGDAFNGKQALELYGQRHPDVIITDMKMPVADGLSLMRQIAETPSPCKMIVVSGYDDFSYTRSAFLVGAVDYLLKPINRTELIDVLIRVDKELRSTQDVGYSYQGLSTVQEQFLSEITWGEAEDENAIIVKAFQHKLELPQEGFRIVAVKLLDTQKCLFERFNGHPYEFFGYVKSVVSQYAPADSVVFNQFYKINEFVVIEPVGKAVCPNWLQGIYSTLRTELAVAPLMGISDTFENLEQLQKAYQQAVEALQGARLNDAAFVCRYGQATASDTAVWQEVIRLLDCLRESQNISAKELLQTLRQALSEQSIATLSVGEIAHYSLLLIERLQSLLQHDHGQAAGRIRPQLGNIRKYLEQLSIRRATERLRGLLPDIAEAVAQYSYTDEQFIADIEAYIREHCADIDLTRIAAHFHLNKNYFSTLFKGLTAQTFSEYLLDTRMQKAVYLLKNTSLRVHDIARQVGYDDAKYFSQVFRKVFGVQPSEYRRGL